MGQLRSFMPGRHTPTASGRHHCKIEGLLNRALRRGAHRRKRPRRPLPGLNLDVLRDLAGKTIMLGVLDLGDPAVETPSVVAGRIRAGLRFVAAEKLVPAPDCGMKYLPRATAFGQLRALADGAAIVRRELAG